MSSHDQSQDPEHFDIRPTWDDVDLYDPGEEIITEEDAR